MKTIDFSNYAVKTNNVIDLDKTVSKFTKDLGEWIAGLADRDNEIEAGVHLIFDQYGEILSQGMIVTYTLAELRTPANQVRVMDRKIRDYLNRSMGRYFVKGKGHGRGITRIAKLGQLSTEPTVEQDIPEPELEVIDVRPELKSETQNWVDSGVAIATKEAPSKPADSKPVLTNFKKKSK